MAYLAKEVRRESLLRAAVDVLRREGPAGVTTRSVAAAASASIGLLHHHFSSTSEVRREAFGVFAAEDFAAMQRYLAGRDPEEALLALLAELLPTDGKESHWRIWCAASDEAQADPVFAEIYMAARERWRGLLRQHLAAVARNADFDTDSAASRLLALADGLIGLALLPLAAAPATRFERAARLLHDALELELGRALSARPESERYRARPAAKRQEQKR